MSAEWNARPERIGDRGTVLPAPAGPVAGTKNRMSRHWFRLLDEVIGGEVVVIERKGQRVMLRREQKSRVARETLPDYSALISVPQASNADAWNWEWSGQESELQLRERID
jgi:hypothetical protein